MPKGEAEATRERRGYVAVARLGVIAAAAGFVSFLLLMRGNVFDPDVTSWPLLLSAAVWALGMVASLWARAKLRAWNAERAAELAAIDGGRAAAAATGDAGVTGDATAAGEHDYWHADAADRAAHAAKEAGRDGE